MWYLTVSARLWKLRAAVGTLIAKLSEFLIYETAKHTQAIVVRKMHLIHKLKCESTTLGERLRIPEQLNDSRVENREGTYVVEKGYSPKKLHTLIYFRGRI